MLKIEVVRKRESVTQGSAEVLINGKSIITFSDKIEMVKNGQEFYGENIGGWASVKSDSDFIIGLLYHPLDDIYHYSDLVKNAILA